MHYLVKLTLRAGEYENRIVSIVRASSSSEAANQAMLNQCHHDIGKGAEYGEGGIYDRYGEVHYSAKSVAELSSEDLTVLERFQI